MNPPQLGEIEAEIARCLDDRFTIDSFTAVSGGDIHQAFKISSSGRNYFLKINSTANLALLQTERNSLLAIHQSGTTRVPLPIVCGKTGRTSFLLLEFFDLDSRRINSARLGESLAKMHRNFSDRFGWPEDNFIGRTPQPNSLQKNWIDFWNSSRLGFQARLAEKNHCPAKTLHLVDKVVQVTPELFKDYKPRPSLLHGDLWAGNAASLADGTPVIFDPASYYGDRETDIAMTELFGGFDDGFYQAYNTSWPLDRDYRARKPLYQLYHVLNHFNLFGGSYAAQAHRLCEEVLANARGR